jgi:hypothetical protein
VSGSGFQLDWQFAVVTLAALWGAWAILRPLLRWRAARKAAACPRCAAGEACASQREGAGPRGQPLVQIGSGRISSAPSAQSGARR